MAVSRIAIDLNDAALVIAGDEQVVAAGPAYAALTAEGLCLGEAAAACAHQAPRLVQRRYWLQMDEAPLSAPLGDCRTGADLVQRQLQYLWAQCAGASSVTLAIMPEWGTEQLALLLGIAREVGMPVTGLVDAAVAASRRPWPGRVLWNLRLGLHGGMLSRIEQDSGARVGERVALERLGIEALERGCADFLARRFVECSRFDPLHTAASEQQLYRDLPAWLVAARREARVSMVLDHAGQRFEAWYEPADLRQHVARLVEPLVQKLRSRCSPRQPSVLQLQGQLADFPGVVEALARLPACTVVLLEPAAVARGALRTAPAADPAAGVRLTDCLPFDQPPEAGEASALAAAVAAPTHIVFEGRAWRLGATPLLIGTEPGESEYGVRLDARLQAVSRRHCVIHVEAGRAMVNDLSRYGTWLNGYRIEGSAVLQPGDVLAVGQPAREFVLVAEVGHAA